MRTYYVYRRKKLVARVRIKEKGQIHWAYRHEINGWQGFWWSNEVKRVAEELIRQYAHGEEFVVAEFTLRRHRS
jgi:hypothetical protein